MIRKLLAALLVVSSTAFAQSSATDSKVASIVTGYTPGGATDIVARLIADKLQGLTGRNYIVENKPGANGLIATQYVRGKPGDGTTLYLIATPFVTAPVTEPDIYKYDPVADFTPISRLSIAVAVIGASSSFGPSDVKSVVAYAKAHPGEVNAATTGKGSSDHLAMLRFAEAAGINLNYVHYKGSASGLQDLMGGQVQLKLDSYAGMRSGVDSGKVKLIAQVTQARSKLLPNVPAASEAYKDYYIESFFGLVGSPNMPAPAVKALSDHMNTILQMSDVRERLASLAMEPAWLPANEFGPYMAKTIQLQKGYVAKLGSKLQ